VHEELKAGAPTITGESLYNLKSEWQHMDGKKIKLSALAGRPRLVAMLYTSCATACPMLVEDMKQIRARLPAEKQKMLDLTVFSFDPARDTPQTLRKFADKRKLDLQTWSLLSPSKPAGATELAAALGVQFKKVKDDYIHSNVIFLLNDKGEIVARKEGLSSQSPEFESALQKHLTQD
jgi:protein SCO1/2